MSPLRIVATAGLAALMSSLTIGSASAAVSGAVAQPAGVHTQHVSITIQRGDRIVEPNFALAPGVPVQIRVTNFTHEFHTFTIAGLNVSALILPSVGQTPKTTVVVFTPQFAGPFTWRCVLCPSGAHGQRHTMGGTAYIILDPSTLP
jgi:hypothetical protein